MPYREFLSGENRYEVLKMMDPEKSEELFDKATNQAKARYEYLKKLQALYEPDNQ